jgi:signal peptidase I
VPPTTERGKIRYPWAIVLSFLGPGAGQIYAGRWRRGVTFAVVYIAILSVATVVTQIIPPSPIAFAIFVPLFLVSLFGLLLWVIIDSVRLIRGASTKSGRPWTHSITLFVLVWQTLAFGFVSLRPFAWRPYVIPSTSNEPTILVGDQLYADGRPAGRVPHRGDVMIFLYPRDKTVSYIKRVIGLPGDTVQLKAGRLYINEKLVPRDMARNYDITDQDNMPARVREYRESLPGGPQYNILKYSDNAHFDVASEVDPNNTKQYKVPPGTIFVLGDNRDNSSDSRFLNDVGYVPLENIVGRATMLYFSWDSIKRTPRWDRALTTIH